MTGRDPSRSPALIELLQIATSRAIEDLFVALPGKIEKYNALTQTVDVLPLIKRPVVLEDGSKRIDELPVIPNVPVAFQRGGGFFVSFPLAKGDIVLLVFCDRSIDKFQSSAGGAPVDPVDLRTNDISDAVAIPGFYPLSKSLKSGIANKNVLALGYDGGGQITVDETGTIETTNALGNFTLKSTGQVDINGNFTVDP